MMTRIASMNGYLNKIKTTSNSYDKMTIREMGMNGGLAHE